MPQVLEVLEKLEPGRILIIKGQRIVRARVAGLERVSGAA